VLIEPTAMGGQAGTSSMIRNYLGFPRGVSGAELVMRVVGMTRAQLRSTIRWESVIIALQGTLLGLVIGLFFGWALVTALKDEGLNTFRVPWASMATLVLLAALAGVLAAARAPGGEARCAARRGDRVTE
jgi:predicted lysophospholipase L1 biosynthesis ABC-type transport system permease subunit